MNSQSQTHLFKSFMWLSRRLGAIQAEFDSNVELTGRTIFEGNSANNFGGDHYTGTTNRIPGTKHLSSSSAKV